MIRSRDNQLLADAVHAAARQAGPSERYGDAVFLSAVYSRFLCLGRERLSGRLVELHRAGLVELSRADLVSAMDPALVAASETVVGDGLATFHLLRAA